MMVDKFEKVENLSVWIRHFSQNFNIYKWKSVKNLNWTKSFDENLQENDEAVLLSTNNVYFKRWNSIIIFLFPNIWTFSDFS